MTNVQPSKTVLFNSPSIVVRNSQGETLGPFYLTNDLHRLGRDPNRCDFPIPEAANWVMVSGCQASFIKEGNGYKIYDGDKVKQSSNGLFFKDNSITTKQGLLLQNGMEITIGKEPGKCPIILYEETNSNQFLKTPKKKSLSLQNKSLEIGRNPQANLHLDAPTVSYRHAIIDSNNQGQYILTDCSTNGVFINGQKVNHQAIIVDGATIRVGPYTLIRKGDNLIVADQGDNIRLDAKNLQRIVTNKKQEEITLLSDISLAIAPGQFVVIVGGSGAGKSTLMKTLLGIEPIENTGIVELNGEDLRQNFNIYRNLIGYVPQYDIVHLNLTVKEVLYYAAKLRLPADINVEQEIEKTLMQISLKDRENTLVKALSGGQLKRVSIGVELLADPRLFFLDEPTSGLDPGLDKKMMELLKQLAEEGRTIILVTHTTLNINLCDRLVFLGKEGHLCYFGPPQEAMIFFDLKSNNFADIYIHLEDKNMVEKEAERFKNNANFYNKYIGQYLTKKSQTSNNNKPKKVKFPLVQQFLILGERYRKLLLRDPLNLTISLITAPLGIIAMRIALSDPIPFNSLDKNDPTLATLSLKVLFVFTCAAIWVGLASSLQEIIKEAKVYQRERLVNLGISAYLLSKAFTLGTLAFCQSLLLSLTILIFFKTPDYHSLAWIIGTEITLFLTLLSTLGLGIMVSALVRNITQANSSLPLLLLPQIIFSGVLFKMTGIGKFLSWLMISRWSVGALGSLVDIGGMIPESSPLNPVTVDIPRDVYETNPENLFINWGCLLLHSLIYWGITYIVQKRKDIL
ncbi:MAG: ATP-binding cassette domain-containing protein [Crocosphaera sp.]|nr:ATP-binding cassette domain-containing protein [Crocosphaera sp.]